MVDGSGGGASGSGRGRARYVILVLASLQLLLSSGLVLGWMGFILIFKGEATFSSGCSSDDRASGACLAAEDLALTKIFTAGMTTAAMAPLPLGLVIDRCASPRLVGVVFAAGTAAGFLVVAVSSNLAVVAAGFALFSFFGSGIQLNLFHVASLFPERKGLVMGLFTTLFGFSALLPMMLFYIWEWLDSPADARRTLFLWFSALLCGFVAFSATMGARFNEGDRVRWGRLGFELVPPETAAGEKKKTADGGAEGAGLGGSQAAGGHLDADEIDVAQGTTAGPEDSSSSSSSLRSLLCSSDYLVFLAFFTLHFFRSLFYLGAVDLQVASIAGSTVSVLAR
jgi:MFS family permease